MSKWIIVVDDDTANLQMAGHILSKNNMRVTALKSGRLLLDYIKDKGIPDLILLDIKMPEMDGFETLRLLRAMEKENGMAETPVIFLTADEDTNTESRGFEMGVSDHIRKPFEPTVLIKRIMNVLKRQEMLHRFQEEATTEAGRSDEEINQMLLEEYQKSQSTREVVEFSTEAPMLAPNDAEYDDMIGDAEMDSQEAMAAFAENDLSEDEEAIIAQAEKDAKEKRAASNYNGILVVSSMNKTAPVDGFDVNLTAEELAAEHPLFLQYDPRWAGYPYGTGTMKSSACGPTSFAMCITALTNITNASPPLVATYSMNHGHYVPGASDFIVMRYQTLKLR